MEQVCQVTLLVCIFYQFMLIEPEKVHLGLSSGGQVVLLTEPTQPTEPVVPASIESRNLLQGSTDHIEIVSNYVIDPPKGSKDSPYLAMLVI